MFNRNLMKQVKQFFMLTLCLLGSMALTAQTFNAAGTPVAIPDAAADISGALVVDIPVSATGIIGTDLGIDNLTLDINHTWSGDLIIDLISPSGSVHTLSFLNGGNGDQFNGTVFTDAATENILMLLLHMMVSTRRTTAT